MTLGEKQKYFKPALEETLLREGKYSFDSMDPGGETYMGISRVYWPEWEGWAVIDRAMENGRKLSNCPELPVMVASFYRANFWNLFRGDDVAKVSTGVASEVFDTGVNLGIHKAASIMQESLNLLNDNGSIFDDLVVDGLIGKRTISNLQLFFDRSPMPRVKKEKMLLNVMNTIQGVHYIEQMKRYPKKERFRGWFLRL